VLSSIEDSSSSWDDLTTTSVDSVSMESNVHNVESNTSHVFLSHDTFFSGPLECSLARILNFVKILNGFSGINEKVRTSSLGSEAPNLLGFIDIPFILVGKSSVSLFLILFGGDFISFNSVGNIISKRGSDDVKSVVLVG